MGGKGSGPQSLLSEEEREKRRAYWREWKRAKAVAIREREGQGAILKYVGDKEAELAYLIKCQAQDMKTYSLIQRTPKSWGKRAHIYPDGTNWGWDLVDDSGRLYLSCRRRRGQLLDG